MGKTITAAGAVVLAFVLGIVMLVVIAVDDQDRKPGIAGQLTPGTIPNGWEPWVVKAGSICPEFPPPLIAAQIAQESGWNPNAVSPVGAQGLSQFMPGTWAAYGVDANGNGTDNPFEPEDAIMAQGAFDCALVDILRAAGFVTNLTELALAAYNAGPGAVITFGGIPPYPDTQAYVPLILGKVAEYGTITGGQAGMGDLAGTGGWPVNAPVTSPFGYRYNPIGGYLELHDGIDFGAPCGTPVISPWSGTVTFAGVAGGFGNRVVLDHGNGWGSSYSHLSSFPVSVGQTVTAGQIVGFVGTTGWSTGCHLHFSVTTNAGVPTDPATVIA